MRPRFRTEASYEDWFPSVHLTYSISENLLVRAAWSTTIGRPDVDELSDSTDINLGSRRITMGNSALVPQYSDNYDLSLDYYFKSMGLISVGVFQKDITDYIAEVSTTITAVPLTADGDVVVEPVMWRNLRPDIATVVVNGGTAIVTARAPGVARIEAEARRLTRAGSSPSSRAARRCARRRSSTRAAGP